MNDEKYLDIAVQLYAAMLANTDVTTTRVLQEGGLSRIATDAFDATNMVVEQSEGRIRQAKLRGEGKALPDTGPRPDDWVTRLGERE